MACRHHHFEARQKPETPERWHQLCVSGWPEVCKHVQKHVSKYEPKIIPVQNVIILLELHHEWHTPISFWVRILQGEDD